VRDFEFHKKIDFMVTSVINVGLPVLYSA